MQMKLSIQLVLVLLLIVTAPPIAVHGADGQIKLTQPTEQTGFPISINKAGSYVLTSNLVVEDPNLDAIEITVNDVTLDLNGHTIQGPNAGPGSGCGVYAVDKFSITVKNGRIYGFGQGINLYSAPDNLSRKGAGHLVEGIQTANNYFNGIYINAGLVTNCTANNNETSAGIEAYNSKITLYTTNNNLNGIWADNSSIKNCTANYNLSGGINANDQSHIEGNNLRDNGGYGLHLSGVDNYVIKNVASDNGGNFGIQMEAENYMPIWPSSDINANYGF